VAKVSLKDSLVKEIKQRYPGDRSLSDRVLMMMSEIDTLKGLVGGSVDLSRLQSDAPTESTPTDDAVGSMMDSLIGSVSVE